MTSGPKDKSLTDLDSPPERYYLAEQIIEDLEAGLNFRQVCRECLNHVIVINQWHLRRILKSDFSITTVEDASLVG